MKSFGQGSNPCGATKDIINMKEEDVDKLKSLLDSELSNLE